MATINYSIKGNNTLKNIYLKLYFRDEVGDKYNIFKNTGLQIQSDKWDTLKTGKRQKFTAELKALKNTLEKLEDKILNRLTEDIKNDSIIDKDWVQFQIDLYFKRVTENNTSTDLLTDSIEELIRTAPVRKNGKGGVGLSTARINKYKRLKSIIQEFERDTKKKYRVKDVNTRFAINFLSYLEERMYSPSYLQKILSDIKVSCRNARSNGIEVSLQLQDIKISKTSNEYINYLNEEEISKIKNLKITNKPLNNARKWILLGCHTGQRGNDLVNLTHKNIITKNGHKYFELKQEKTGKPIHIPFNTEIEDIISEGFPYRLNINGESGFNKRFKEIGKLAKINNVIEGKKYNNELNRMVKGNYPKWQLLRTHDLRRTFATNLYGKLSNTIIMAITGHSTEQMLLKYIGKNSIEMAENLADYYKKEDLKKNIDKRMIVLKNASGE